MNEESPLTGAIRDLEAHLWQSLADMNASLAEGAYPAVSTHRQVAGEFLGVQYARHYEGGRWEGGREDWIRGTEEAAAALSEVAARWEMRNLVVLARDEMEAVAQYVLVLHWRDEGRPPAAAMFLETYARRDGAWQLLRHTAEKAPWVEAAPRIL
jgi:hypothetical protein